MQTSDSYRAFWRRMAERYQQQLALAKTEADRAKWAKRIAEAEEKAGINLSKS